MITVQAGVAATGRARLSHLTADCGEFALSGWRRGQREARGQGGLDRLHWYPKSLILRGSGSTDRPGQSRQLATVSPQNR